MARSSTPRADPRASLPASKLLRLMAYLDEMGEDGAAVAAGVGLDPRQLADSREDSPVPALYYGLLYNETVRRLPRGDLALPWGAGIGGKIFALMAHCLIDCRNLGEALLRAAEFDAVVSPQLKGDRIGFVAAEPGRSRLTYAWTLLDAQRRFVPAAIRDTDMAYAVGAASGLRVLHAFSGWLTGRALELTGVGIGAPGLPPDYAETLGKTFHCPIERVGGDSWLEFEDASLGLRIVQDGNTLADLLRTGPYELMRMDAPPDSTSAAIRSLLGTRFREGLPGFDEIAVQLGMSASSLRRRLMGERTSYQKLKDECRRDAAIRMLRDLHLSVAEIGELLGFTETSSFIRSFKGWTGTTPRAFRDRLASAAR